MIVEYDDFDGNTRCEECYFNLRIDELAEMAALDGANTGDFEEYLKEIIAKKDVARLIAIMKLIMQTAYGRRSADGMRFVKDVAYWREFQETGAFGSLLTELVMDANKMAAFMNGIMPPQLAKNNDEEKPIAPTAVGSDPRKYTTVELRTMPSDEFYELFGFNKP